MYFLFNSYLRFGIQVLFGRIKKYAKIAFIICFFRFDFRNKPTEVILSGTDT